MSELTIKTTSRTILRWNLLSTTSLFVLVAGFAVAARAADNEDGRPTFWIEFGAQLEHLDVDQSPFAPPFLANYASSEAFNPSPLGVQKLPNYSIGGEGKLSFSPEGTDWVFGVSARYGRSNSTRHLHKEATVTIADPKYIQDPIANPFPFVPYALNKVSDAKAVNRESHAILDFQVGRDVGVGLFGHDSTSVLNLGVRFAQFTSSTTTEMHARPDISFEYKYIPPTFAPPGISIPLAYFHDFQATVLARRSFHGLGPSLSWEGSIPVAGNPDTAEFALDLGVNGALLFGRQKANITHSTTGYYYKKGLLGVVGTPRHITYQNPATKVSRSHSVTVPNLGGLADLSVKFPNAKVSLGYRVDHFFGAMDEGAEVRRSNDVGFHGPFATISIGLGG